MRPAVRWFFIVAGLLTAAACILGCLFVIRTNGRLDQLESYLDGRRSTRDSQYEEQRSRIDHLEKQLCQLAPSTCRPGQS